MNRLALALVWFAACALAQPGEPKMPVLPDWVSAELNIPYDTHKQTVLDLLAPKQKIPGKRPAALVIHGGGWVRGSKESQVEPICMRYLEKGFVVANVEYRLAAAATAPAAVMDVLKAADWLRRNAGRYGADSKRIVVTGGHLSLMVGLTPKSAKLGKPAQVAAVVNFYGITDVGDQLHGENMREYAVTWLPEQEGRMELAARVSPVTYVRRVVPPVLTLHGTADETVPYEHGVRLTRLLREAGATAELISVPDGKHGFPKEKLDQLYPQIWDFLTRVGVLK
jgi:acetyl esterase/lipase